LIAQNQKRRAGGHVNTNSSAKPNSTIKGNRNVQNANSKLQVQKGSYRLKCKTCSDGEDRWQKEPSAKAMSRSNGRWKGEGSRAQQVIRSSKEQRTLKEQKELNVTKPHESVTPGLDLLHCFSSDLDSPFRHLHKRAFK